jgi:hypothetical protein
LWSFDVSKIDESSRIQELRRALTRADAAAFLVEPRVIRRVIRERYGFAKLSASIPHTESLIVAGADVRNLVHPDELGLTSFQNLPSICVLICEPDEGELEHWPMQELLARVWRRLFHAQIDRILLEKMHSTIRRADVQERINQIGQVEFDEAHFVLRSEQRLTNPESRIEAWREFVAVYLELKHFEPDLLPIWFPSIAGSPRLEATFAEDINAVEIFQRTQLYGATKPDLTPNLVRDEARLQNTRRDWSLGIGIVPSDRSYLRSLRRRDRANERGNTVAAVVCAIRAVQRATSDDKRAAAHEKARADIRHLVDRLRRAIDFPESDTEAWQVSLWELATNSVHGFWNSEKRLLYDLQKVCLDHERVTYKVDLVKWIVSRGRRPLRRPLNSLREVMMARHLASSTARLVYVRLSGIERERLTGLLQRAAHLAEEQMRQRVRPVLHQTLRDVGLEPSGVPEQVAFDKLAEDSLDCIADRGYLNMGYLRDAISKNDLKLPDLRQMNELWRGDHLLRADDRLDLALDGVYRRGEFYLRWLQVISSIFFGTALGRFTTLFLVIPFGGSLVIVEGVRHIFHLLQRKPAAAKSSSLENGSGEELASDPAVESAQQESGTLTDSHSAIESAQATPAEPDAAAGIENAVARLEATDTEPLDSNTSLVAEAAGSNPSETAAETSLKGVPEAIGNTDTASGETGNGTAVIEVSASPDDAVEQIVGRQVETISWVLLIGFLLMALIHVPEIRRRFFEGLSLGWTAIRTLLLDAPLKLLRLPIVQRIWRHRTFIRLRRYVLIPLVAAIIPVQVIPWILTGAGTGWGWVVVVSVLMSIALNSRLGQDAQELSAEWVGNTWHKLRARVVIAILDWIIDVFRTLLNFVERFLYAVDEWLRFHSDESWLSIVAKAVTGVVWSFVSFLIRIYVNLLIEPTLHPVKHFPVVTVAHKMFLPLITVIGAEMLKFFSAYLGVYLAGLITGFNIFFLPGIFGFLVWELKENWRLYQANRKPMLMPVVVGSHGETVARLLRPGFHSGTLPRLHRKLRRLEHQDASFKRFSARRAAREKLEHVESAVRKFVDRELIHLLELCPVWTRSGLKCGAIRAASNSFSIDLECAQLGDAPVRILFQEQSTWVAASVPEIGWLRYASADQVRSFQNALEGFYRKAGIDVIREQLQARFIHQHPYDINSEGLAIWPNGDFSQEISVDLNRKGPVRAIPASEAAAAGINSMEREAVVFSESQTDWGHWRYLWNIDFTDLSRLVPPACRQPSAHPVLPPIR